MVSLINIHEYTFSIDDFGDPKVLKNGKAKLKKCRSVKTGKTYDCTVVLSVNDSGQAQFSLDFGNQGKK